MYYHLSSKESINLEKAESKYHAISLILRIFGTDFRPVETRSSEVSTLEFWV